MFEHTQVTGTPDNWIALPAGYQPGGSYERIATGESETITMLREVTRIMGKLPKHSADRPAKLVVSYSPALADSSAAVRTELDRVRKSGEKVGVYCTETYDAHKR